MYRAGLVRELNATLAYRGSILIWTFGTVATSYISLLIWLAVLGERPTVGAFGRAGLVQYYLGSAIISMWTSSWAVYWVSEEIRMGELNRHLLKPWSYLHWHIINNLGEKITKTLIMLPMLALVVWLFRDDWRWGLGWGGTLLVGVTIVLGAAVSLLINVSVGLISFWATEVAGIWALYLALSSLLSGRLIPLALFPASLRTWLWLSPFRYELSLPLELMIGQLSGPEVAISVALQIGWVAVSYLVYRTLWRYGTRRYAAVGG